MRIPMSCNQCWEQSGELSEVFGVELSGECSFATTCPHGHTMGGTLQSPRFEILFDAGMLAHRDGYNREAVFDFAASLEQFYTYYVRVVARSQGIAAGELDATWKGIDLSERQLGAMYVAHLLNTRTAFTGDDNKRRSFRNGVVHRGKFPTHDQTRDYANYVYDTITSHFEQLKQTPGTTHIQQETSIDLAERNRKLRKRYPKHFEKWGPATIGGGHMIGTIRGDGPRSFQDALRDWADGSFWRLAEFAATRPQD